MGLNLIAKGEGERRELDNNSQQSWIADQEQVLREAPCIQLVSATMVCKGPHIHPFKWEGAGIPKQSQDAGWLRQHHGYRGNQTLLLTAAFVGWQP